MNIHVGGRSALGLLGLAHYLQVNAGETILFSEGQLSLPSWLLKNQWDTKPRIFRVSLFQQETVELVDYQTGELNMKISGTARAMMECLSLCPNQFPLMEAFELMEGLATLRPAQAQELLEQCKSIKVKRLFLHFAEKAGHNWLKYIDTSKIDLGSGNRSLAESGVLAPKYHLILPKELV
jgi:hypothetical protein